MTREVVILERPRGLIADMRLDITVDGVTVVVVTWADGYGIWNVTVPIMEDRELEQVVALYAIRHRLEEREVQELSDLHVVEVNRPGKRQYRHYREAW